MIIIGFARRTALVVVAALVVFASAGIGAAQAAGSYDLSGYAWSDSVGWVSLSCSNDSSCGSSNYGVSLDPEGSLDGYAWSSNIGWIQFGCPTGGSCLSGFPSGSGTQAQNANINGNNLKGWARALSYGGGWDGWVSLSGAGYGVTVATSTFSGYAWGGDVIGWLSFDAAGSLGVRMSASASLSIVNGNGVSIVDSGSVPYGTVPTFSWSISGLPSGASCSVSKVSVGGTDFSARNGLTTSGSQQGDALVQGTYAYRIQCVQGATTIASSQYGFTVLPQPASFSLGGPETARIQFVGGGQADSEEKTVFVSSTGGFNSPVTIAVTGSPDMPASTTISYKLGSSGFSANPSPVQLYSPYAVGTTFQVRISREVTQPYTVTLTGTAAGYPAATKTFIVNPTSKAPRFEEY